eukprot:gene1134-1472_t
MNFAFVGRYAADQVMSLSADVARRTAASRTPGSFGSAADRFGAGDTNSNVFATCVFFGIQGFASASKRFAPSVALPTAPDYSSWDGEDGTLRGDASRLGPGLYRLQASSDDRRGMGPTPGLTPGPGAYSNAAKDMHQIFRPLSVPETNRASFSAGSRRFATSSTSTPGPGAYTAFVPDGSSTFLKPSFNVTAGR